MTTMLTMDAWSPDRTTGDIWIDLSEGASREVSMIIEFSPWTVRFVDVLSKFSCSMQDEGTSMSIYLPSGSRVTCGPA